VNARIQELAEQAFTAVGTTHDSITHQDQSVLDKNNSITSYTFTQNTMEKFAELIVQECITQCEQFLGDPEASIGAMRCAITLHKLIGIDSSLTVIDISELKNERET
jgi:hypothetical protein